MESAVDPVKSVQRGCEVNRVSEVFKAFPELQVSMEL
jgi:hypothetical protein